MSLDERRVVPFVMAIFPDSLGTPLQKRDELGIQEAEFGCLEIEAIRKMAEIGKTP